MNKRFLPHLFLAVIVFIIALGSWNTIAAPEKDSKNQEEKSTTIKASQSTTLSFKWAILHRDQQGKVEVLDFNNSPTVRSGDSLKIFVWPLKGVFIYIYLKDSKKELSPLFPQPTEIYKIGKPYYIPDEDGWFELDSNKGIETFYLIASRNPLTDLERLTRKYLSATGEKKDEAKVNVLSEIKNARRRFSQFTTIGEIPVPITGTARETGLKVDLLATQIEAENFYGKTLKLDHK